MFAPPPVIETEVFARLPDKFRRRDQDNAWAIVNRRGIRTGAMVQNVFTVAKTAALLGLVGLGFLVGRNAEAVAANFTDFWRNSRHGILAYDQVILRRVRLLQRGCLFYFSA